MRMTKYTTLQLFEKICTDNVFDFTFCAMSHFKIDGILRHTSNIEKMLSMLHANLHIL